MERRGSRVCRLNPELQIQAQFTGERREMKVHSHRARIKFVSNWVDELPTFQLVLNMNGSGWMGLKGAQPRQNGGSRVHRFGWQQGPQRMEEQTSRAVRIRLRVLDLNIASSAQNPLPADNSTWFCQQNDSRGYGHNKPVHFVSMTKDILQPAHRKMISPPLDIPGLFWCFWFCLLLSFSFFVENRSQAQDSKWGARGRMLSPFQEQEQL